MVPTTAAPSATDPYPEAIDPKTVEKKYQTQPFFLRKEAIDAAYYLYPLGYLLDTKGASVTYTRDELAKSSLHCNINSWATGFDRARRISGRSAG